MDGSFKCNNDGNLYKLKHQVIIKKIKCEGVNVWLGNLSSIFLKNKTTIFKLRLRA